MTKLTEPQWTLARKMRLAGCSFREIARELGCDHATVMKGLARGAGPLEPQEANRLRRLIANGVTKGLSAWAEDSGTGEALMAANPFDSNEPFVNFAKSAQSALRDGMLDLAGREKNVELTARLDAIQAQVTLVAARVEALGQRNHRRGLQ